MQIGFVGLGRMGHNMVLNLLDHKHSVVVYDKEKEATTSLEQAGARSTCSLGELVEALDVPRVIWIMVPREAVQSVLDEIESLLQAGDTIIEGGNTYFKDTIDRAKYFENKEVNYIDVGVSGGVEGARNGACLMVGGKIEHFKQQEQIFRDLSVENGYGYMGDSGAGHFVKMVHNGIEYGMMGAIAEGMQAVSTAKNFFDTNLDEVIKVYNHGSIIESRLFGWMSDAWKKDPDLSKMPAEVPYGETEEEMEKLEALSPMSVLAAARSMRVETRSDPSFMGKVINALRLQFGGHSPDKNNDV